MPDKLIAIIMRIIYIVCIPLDFTYYLLAVLLGTVLGIDEKSTRNDFVYYRPSALLVDGFLLLVIGKEALTKIQESTRVKIEKEIEERDRDW